MKYLKNNSIYKVYYKNTGRLLAYSVHVSSWGNK